jgi:hypothetical protein
MKYFVDEQYNVKLKYFTMQYDLSSYEKNYKIKPHVCYFFEKKVETPGLYIEEMHMAIICILFNRVQQRTSKTIHQTTWIHQKTPTNPTMREENVIKALCS